MGIRIEYLDQIYLDHCFSKASSFSKFSVAAEYTIDSNTSLHSQSHTLRVKHVSQQTLQFRPKLIITFGTNCVHPKTPWVHTYTQTPDMGGCDTCCAVVCACLCPPMAVIISRGCGCDLVINLLLTLLGWFPGCIHACCLAGDDGRDGNISQSVHVTMPSQHPYAPLQQPYPMAQPMMSSPSSAPPPYWHQYPGGHPSAPAFPTIRAKAWDY
jgi:uncharacterized membrane protein YqaE (UPF0057 family)